MAPYGTISGGKDSSGNYKVRPLEGGRTVILIGSRKLALERGQVVMYDATREGDYVDFAEGWSIPRDQTEIQVARQSPKSASEVTTIVAKADLRNTKTLMVYDPIQHVLGSHYFVAVSRSMEGISSLIKSLIGLGLFPWFDYPWEHSFAGKLGQQYFTATDFRPRIDGRLMSGVFVLPIEGLNAGSTRGIPFDNLRACVEAAQLPLEDRLT